MRGIVSYSAYVPYWRLERPAIAAALGTPPGKGTRAVASYDEDATTMGVEAARRALSGAPPEVDVGTVLFTTTDPPYLDKTNATAIHAALGLDRSVLAVDMLGSVRSVVGATKAAVSMGDNTLLVLADLRTGLPGGADEAGGGDGAAAFLFANDDRAGDGGRVVAENLAIGNATAEFLDRWRIPGEAASRVWEERFGEHVYLPLAEEAITAAFKAAGITAESVDHLLVTGVHARAARAVVRIAGVRTEAVGDDLTTTIGNTGAAHPGILLADALDRAEPGQVICRVILADGVSVSLWRTTDALPGYRARRVSPTVQQQVAAGRTGLPYATFLSWRGQLHREPPRRPEPTAPAAPPSFRNEAWKFGFTASRCECGTRHLPPARVCLNCGAVDQMVPERLADVPATITTFTVDRLAFTPSPPLVAAVVDFDGGGRYRFEVTDVDPHTVAIGDRVEMTFRRISTAQGVHNYFWKARPLHGGGGDG